MAGLTLVVPYAPGRLCEATRQAVASYEPRYVCMDSGASYWQLLRDLWLAGQTFFVVEQDVVVRPGCLEELLACPADWCGFAYTCSGGDAPYYLAGLGCTKFESRLLARCPDLLELFTTDQERYWNGLDARLATQLAWRGHRNQHEHFPPVEHQHAYDPPLRSMPWPAQSRADRQSDPHAPDFRPIHLRYTGSEEVTTPGIGAVIRHGDVCQVLNPELRRALLDGPHFEVADEPYLAEAS